MLADRSLRRALWVSAWWPGHPPCSAPPSARLTALVLVRRAFRGRGGFSTLVLAPLVLPEIVLAVGLLVLVASAGIRSATSP